MSKWEMVRLGDVCLLITKGTTPTTLGCPFEEHGINFIKIESISEYGCFLKEKFQYISPECNQKLKRSQLKERDILFSIAGALGRTAIVTNDILPANINQALAIIRLNDTALDAQFIVKVLNSNSVYEQFQKQKQGVAQLNLSLKNVSDLQIPLPPLAEQKKIAAELDKISGLIAKRKRQIEKLDLLVKAKFVEMFGDETKFYRWECKVVGDVADISVGVVIKPAQYYTNEKNGIRAFRSLNVGNMRIKDDNWVFFTKEGHEKNQKSKVRRGDVLVVRSGAPGTACIITKDYEGCNAIDVIIARPDSLKVNSVYLCAFTNYPHGQKQIQEGTGGAAQQHFNIGRYKELVIPLPPLPLQTQFADFVQKVVQTKSTMQKSLVGLETLYKARMQEYFE